MPSCGGGWMMASRSRIDGYDSRFTKSWDFTQGCRHARRGNKCAAQGAVGAGVGCWLFDGVLTGRRAFLAVTEPPHDGGGSAEEAGKLTGPCALAGATEVLDFSLGLSFLVAGSFLRHLSPPWPTCLSISRQALAQARHSLAHFASHAAREAHPPHLTTPHGVRRWPGIRTIRFGVAGHVGGHLRICGRKAVGHDEGSSRSAWHGGTLLRCIRLGCSLTAALQA